MYCPGKANPRYEENVMIDVTLKEMLEAGVHFGHQTKRWNPKMKRFIYGERNGIYILDLQQTVRRFRVAREFAKALSVTGAASYSLERNARHNRSFSRKPSDVECIS